MDIRSLISKAPKNSELSRRAMLRAAGLIIPTDEIQKLAAEAAGVTGAEGDLSGDSEDAANAQLDEELNAGA